MKIETVEIPRRATHDRVLERVCFLYNLQEHYMEDCKRNEKMKWILKSIEIYKLTFFWMVICLSNTSMIVW